MKEKICLNANCNKYFLANGNQKWCSLECRYPAHPCSWVGCNGIATKSNYCSIACRNKHIGFLSKDKNKEAQNRPDVKLKKSIGQKKAFENLETKLKHKEAINNSYLNGRVSWNKNINLKKIKCDYCNKDLVIHGYKDQRFCSVGCSNKKKKFNTTLDVILKHCINCNKLLKKNNKFCGHSCAFSYQRKNKDPWNKGKVNNREVLCALCNKSFYVNLKSKRKYCSKLCESKDPERRKQISNSIKSYSLTLSKEEKFQIYLKGHETAKANNSYGKSKLEDKIFDYLKIKYPDIVRQYLDKKRYPFACDFYIPSHDLFIEFQGHWTHGLEPYNGKNTPIEWIEKSLNSDYFKLAVKIFTKSDPNKREYALANNLNFVEIWGEPSLSYIDTQIKRSINGLNSSYSLEECKKELNVIINHSANYKASPRDNKIILTYQPHFYSKEQQLWRNPNINRKLVLNRSYYLNKTEEELTDKDLLRGFKISGIHYGFSHFSPMWIKAFIEEFKINSIYDPCAGWGHRLLGAQNIKYIGNDLNMNTYNGLKRIVNDFDLKDKIILNNDCREYIPNFNYEAVFTCPPYYDTEDYQGEVLPKYQEWLKTFWDKTVKNCLVKKPKYFAFVICKKYSEDFKRIAYNNNLLLVKDVHVGGDARSHFARHSDLKPKKSDILSIFSC